MFAVVVIEAVEYVQLQVWPLVVAAEVESVVQPGLELAAIVDVIVLVVPLVLLVAVVFAAFDRWYAVAATMTAFVNQLAILLAVAALIGIR